MVLRPGHLIMLICLSLADISFFAEKSVAEIVIGDVPLSENLNINLGRPTALNGSPIVISRSQYVISWNVETRSPEWVSWALKAESLGDVSRSNTFHIDKELDVVLRDQNRKSVSPGDYRGTCIDRGHQVASADRTASEVDNQSTFFMSNVTPQSAFLNRRVWVSLERFIRRRIVALGERAYLITGSIYDSDSQNIGPDQDIRVPKSNFKVVVLTKDGSRFGRRSTSRFLVVNLPNVTSQGTNPVTDHRQACIDAGKTSKPEDTNLQAIWRPYLENLVDIESLSGLSFEFLRSIHQMTPDEVDELIVEDGRIVVDSSVFTARTSWVQPQQIFPWLKSL
jgi:endonuclease G